MGLLENPLILGTIVFVLVWVFRRLGLDIEGLKALWFTMVVAVVVAVAERLFATGIPNFLVCEMVSEPVASLTCLFAILRTILEEAAVVFAAAELIYQLLRREIAGRTILGERI